MKNASASVDVIDHAITANSQSERLYPFEAAVRMRIEGSAETVDGGFYSGLNRAG
jgi:hypothetical protein